MDSYVLYCCLKCNIVGEIYLQKLLNSCPLYVHRVVSRPGVTDRVTSRLALMMSLWKPCHNSLLGQECKQSAPALGSQGLRASKHSPVASWEIFLFVLNMFFVTALLFAAVHKSCDLRGNKAKALFRNQMSSIKLLLLLFLHSRFCKLFLAVLKAYGILHNVEKSIAQSVAAHVIEWKGKHIMAWSHGRATHNS